jgi:hypothetical protein
MKGILLRLYIHELQVHFAISDDDATRLLESPAAEPLHLPLSRQPMERRRTVTA